jgi:chitodextrinase
LTAKAVNSNQVSLGWTASTDNVGVTGYNVLRNGRWAGQATGTSYVDTTVSPSTPYSYTVEAYDDAGNISSASNIASVTTPAASTNPPVISSVASSNVTQTSATITWNTDIPSSSQVEYGTTSSYGQTTTLDTRQVTGHSQTITGLVAGTTYHYAVRSTGASNNSSTSGDNTFTAPDTQPPVVSITNPINNETLSGTVPVAANATDDGAVASVQFYLDGQPLGSPVTTSPYAINWDTTKTTSGTHTLYAVATDVGGLSTTSASVSVVVDSGGSPANTTEPVITGTVATGDMLSVSRGTWTGSPTSYSYQWQDCGTDGTGCSNIVGAMSSTYTVASGDAGHTIEAVVTATNGAGSTTADTPIVPLVDEFSGSSVDTNVWDVLNQQGDTSNSETVCYITGQTTEGSGTLTETAVVKSRPAPPTSGHCPTGTPNSTATSWDSGAVQEASTAFTYGTVVVRAKLAGPGTAMWPVIWLLGAECQTSSTAPFTYLSGTSGNQSGYYCNWDNDSSDASEIDIAEGFEKSTTSINEQLHNTGTGVHCTPTLTNYSTNYHTYELDWSAGSLTWKIDGTTTCSTTSGVPSHPMFLIINNGVCSAGSVCAGSPVGGDFPTSTTVDYVHISH